MSLGKGSKNKNENLKWHLPLGVGLPPPLNGTNFHPFFTPLFSFAFESPSNEPDFTLGPIKNIVLKSSYSAKTDFKGPRMPSIGAS